MSFHAKSDRVISRALSLWREVYEPAGIVPTVRQYFYALAVEELVPKNQQGYDKVQRLLAAAREKGAFPWEAVYDALRQIRRPNVWNGLADFFETVYDAYRLDKWQFQPRRVEVWIEKDAVRGTVERVTDGLQVPLLCDRGYLSVSAKKEASRRILRGKMTILYIGDFDPSGINMLEEAEEWVRADGAGDLIVERIAIDEKDYQEPKVPHLPVNRKDARATEFIERYGDEVVEVEALPPKVLQERLRSSLHRHMDLKAWKKANEREKREIQDIHNRLTMTPP